MKKLESTKFLNELLQHDATEVLDWLKQVWSGKLSSPINFNWHGLAEAAAFDARLDYGNNSPLINLSWAEVATSIYDYLAQRAGSGGESFSISAMLLRAAMIAEFGAILGHPVLDIDKVINWFYDSSKMSLDQAMTKADNWKNCSFEEIRELRKIKNRLKIISILAEKDKIISNVELSTWLALRDKLP